ncbi:MAG: hypothetical protein ACLTR8_11415 [Oscillospiraceae bacterium]
MEEKKDTLGMLDLVIRPGFCVKENQIIKVNQAAESLFITPGTDVRPLLLTGSEEYAAFTGGCLYLTLSLSSHSCGASVTRVDDIDVFLLEQESDNGELRSMALAARELREPLTNVMITADSLFPLCAAESSPRTAEQVARLNRGCSRSSGSSAICPTPSAAPPSPTRKRWTFRRCSPNSLKRRRPLSLTPASP